MSWYFVRHDAMTQATTTFAAVETGSDGSTAGAIRIPSTAKKIRRITAGFVVDGAQTTITGPIFVLRLTGVNALVRGNQDFVLGSLHLEDGGGTLTYTDAVAAEPFSIETDIDVIPGSDLQLQAAYYGADAGSPQISVEVEFT